MLQRWFATSRSARVSSSPAYGILKLIGWHKVVLFVAVLCGAYGLNRAGFLDGYAWLLVGFGNSVTDHLHEAAGGLCSTAE